MPPKPSTTDCSGTSSKTGTDWLELELPVIKPGEEPLPHRSPSYDAIMAHARMLLPWWRQIPEVPKNTEQFHMEADLPDAEQ